MAGARPSIVIAAGGTGGHIYPGLAVAGALQDLAPDARITFVGTRRGMEGELVPAAGHDLRFYDMAQFNNQGWRKALVPAIALRGAAQARRILRDVGADVALSMGGYSGVPLVLAARTAGVPSVVFEPGAVPGQANRLAARCSRHIATAFAHTRFPGRDARHVGYPLQPAMAAFDRAGLRAEARATYGAGPLTDATCLVVVVGASQGSRSLNQLALGLAERWRGRDDVRILLKAGSRTYDETADALAANPGRDLVDLVRYIDRMDHAYAAADIVVSRAGAGTVTELSVVGVPSVLVPLPNHEHDEQGENARVLLDTSGAFLVRDHDARADVVGPLLEPLLVDRAARERMGAAARTAARPDAASSLADWVLSLVPNAKAAA